jgi:hypothetical protein
MLPACQTTIVEYLYGLMQELRPSCALLYNRLSQTQWNTGWEDCSLFPEKPLRIFEGIRYDSGLFGRDDKRRQENPETE